MYSNQAGTSTEHRRGSVPTDFELTEGDYLTTTVRSGEKASPLRVPGVSFTDRVRTSAIQTKGGSSKDEMPP